MAKGSDGPLYLGVDIGGTKVLAALVTEAGRVVAREKVRTPRDVEADGILATIEEAIRAVVKSEDHKLSDIRATGVAVPGVVDPKRGRVIVAPNLNFDMVDIGPELEKRIGGCVVVGNDCNLGALGERWLGAGREARSVFAILWGTGIGGGFVRKGKLWRGARESASEIGHIIMQIDGPTCGCGNQGCFEALASRTAIERDIRAAVASGQESLITELAEGDLNVIRSGMLRRALEAEDPVVTSIMQRAAETVGHACLTVRHLIDPDVIILGGGVIEACGRFLMPTIQQIVQRDQLPGAREGGQVLVSALGDDAVLVGAVALAQCRIGRSPFKKKYRTEPTYASVRLADGETVEVGGESYQRDIYIRPCGKVKRRDESLARRATGSPRTIGRDELRKVCRGGPEVLIIGAGPGTKVELTDEAKAFLRQRLIEHEIHPVDKAVARYNKEGRRRALLLNTSA